MPEQIADEVKSFIMQSILIGAMEEPLANDDSFLQKGILDSTGILELVGFLERKYGIICADHEITPENLDTVNAIARFVWRKLSVRSGQGND